MVGKRMLVFAVMAGLMLGSAALAGYEVVVEWQTFVDAVEAHAPGGAPTSYGKAVGDGTTVYAEIRRFSPTVSWFVRVENAGTPSESASVVWDYIGSNTSGASLNVVGSDLTVAGSGADEVWRFDKGGADLLGPPDVYLSKVQMQAEVGGDAITSGYTGVDNNGEMYFYETDLDQICRTTGPGTAEVLIDNAALVAAGGSDLIQGQLAFDGANNLFFLHSNNDSMYRFDGTNLTQVISMNDIIAITGGTKAGVAGHIYNPSTGLMYFQELYERDILSYDPADPAGTLSLFVTKEILTVGPLGTYILTPFTLFNGEIAATAYNKGTMAFCTIPEPMTLALLSVGGMALIRRRR